MKKNELRDYSIGQLLTVQLQIADSMHYGIWQTVSSKSAMDKRGLYNKEEKV